MFFNQRSKKKYCIGKLKTFYLKSLNFHAKFKIYAKFKIIEPTAINLGEVDLPITVIQRTVRAILSNEDNLKNSSLIEKDANVTFDLLLVDAEGQELANIGYKVVI